MRLAVSKWNVSIVGENKPLSYYGFKTKKEALAFIENWNETHELKVELLRG